MEKTIDEKTITVLQSSVKIQREIISSLERQLAITEEIIELKDETIVIIDKQLKNSSKLVFITAVMWVVLFVLSIIKICM